MACGWPVSAPIRYSYEAVKELNMKAKNWSDLLTGEKFTKKDIITLLDPKV